ncbi:DUF6635 family protein [Paracoccus fistulariae]|uniref:Uncharacterized protein n=1 Tax=Paracoccus fistulariae TaxID=658446 RepID=A0ABY7SJI7_9RHOB|nr:DUF6635 family protein [Paracoccus fistulariae]MDB6182023.1 hypothetical protein [Paracoccus fistulariae]WCR06743.1 hypothetical protein JHX87_14870 [Paracoccus fistulariae]
MTDATDPARLAARQDRVSRFVRARFGLRGTLLLHRTALGWDLLRAPLNVMLSPVFLLTRLLAALLGWLGARRAAGWLARRRIFLTSDMSRILQQDLIRFIDGLDADGIGPGAPPQATRDRIASYTETRNAVAEIVTSLVVLSCGLLLFHRATPGIISMAGPLAELRARSNAVADFALGETLGRAWYWAFPVQLSPWEVVLTGVALAMIGSVVTTFAGVLADPLQTLTGTHRRRLMRMLSQLDRAEPGSGIEREHLLARLGDLGDTLTVLWRSLR